MFCPNCGNPITEKDAFCGKCGTHFYANQNIPGPPPKSMLINEKAYLVIMVVGMIYSYATLTDDALYPFVAAFFLAILKDTRFPNYNSFSKPFKRSLWLVFIAFAYVFYQVGMAGTTDWGSVIFLLLFPILALMITLAILIGSFVTYSVGFLLFKLIRT